MSQLNGLRFVSDVESENPAERAKRDAARAARKYANLARYVRHYERIRAERNPYPNHWFKL